MPDDDALLWILGTFDRPRVPGKTGPSSRAPGRTGLAPGRGGEVSPGKGKGKGGPGAGQGIPGIGANPGSGGGGVVRRVLPPAIPFENILLQVPSDINGSTTFTDQSTGFGSHTMAQSGAVKHSSISVPPLVDEDTCIDFPGTGYFQANDHVDFDLPGNYGMDVWFRTTVGGDLITKYDFNFQRAFRFGISPADGILSFFQFGDRTSSTNFLHQVDGTLAGDLRDGEWHHALFSHIADANQTGRIFVDGILAGDAANSWGGSWPIDATTAPVRYGQTANGSLSLTGQIAWPRIWRDFTGPVINFELPTLPPPTS